jgi:NAD(P)-dependent dehydrogenase (short-subunit alcohol dehydrogenase family)
MSRVCLVTGGARGIGRATALAAARDGWHVAVNYRERQDAADALVGEIETLGRKALAVQGDIADAAAVVALFAAVDKGLGPLGALVNSAGISRHNRVDALVEADLVRMLAVNVTGLMLCCREAAKRMSSKYGGRGGSIVNVSSMAATIGGRAGASTYAASKGAVDVFTAGFAKEVAAEGTRVNAVRPGVIDTEMIGAMRSGPRRTELDATIPMKRFGTPGEVAQTIVWLLSDKASFVTGAHVNIGGGGFLVG